MARMLRAEGLLCRLHDNTVFLPDKVYDAGWLRRRIEAQNFVP